MSIIAEVTRKLGVNSDAVLRVAREGGTTAADWAIAEAIEAAGGRKAAEMMAQVEARMWRAEHNRLQTALWEKTQPQDVAFLTEHAANAGITDITPLLPAISTTAAEAPATTNPHAVYDPEVVTYPEDTAPDGPNQIAPHHPNEAAQDDEPADDRQAAEDFATRVHADLAEVLDDADAAGRLTAAWVTPAEGQQVLRRVLETTPRTRQQIALRTLLAA